MPTDEGYNGAYTGVEIDEAISKAKKLATYTATLGTAWEEDAATGVKSQFVAIEGVTAENDAQADVYYSGDGSSESYATFVEQQNQFLEFITNGYAETVEGGITFYIFGETNTVSIPIVVEVG